MSSTLKVVPKQKVFAETGSAFDTTNIEKQIKVAFINLHSILITLSIASLLFI